MVSKRIFAAILAVPVICVGLGSSGAQRDPQSPPAMRGFSPAQAAEEWAWEQKMRALPQPTLMREYQAQLASAPHHVGSPKDQANAEWILAKLKSFGLNASIEEFSVLYPTPKERLVELVSPERYIARLKEPAFQEDPDTAQPGQLPPYNVYAGDGNVTAPLVYVNYGVPEDYRTLEEMGIDVKGKIVLARYGGSWRGIKPKVAYEHGAIGCLIYSDPKDDGYYQGLVYPEGPYRPEQGVQRGSVMDMPLYPGDPLTQGIGAVAGARRISRAEAATIMKIPVMPLSYGDALPLLKNLRGPVAPESWRGALPVTYCVGPGPAVVHFRLSSDWSLRPVRDVIARIEGSTFPDQWVIQGNHYDAWVFGASDPISGAAPLLEEARALGDLVKQGWRPKRTVILAFWDGEEAGLLGSTEWTEQHAAELAQKAVVYMNTDSNGKGWLQASGSHSLTRFVHEVARDTADPVRAKSVYDAWLARRLEQATGEPARQEIAKQADLPIAALGSGSDYTAFIDHLGVSSLDLGFGGEGGGGVYHSSYDSLAWFRRFSDADFAYGRILAQFMGTAVLRLGDAAVLPFEFINLAETTGSYLAELSRLPGAQGNVNLSALEHAHQTLAQSAQAFESAYARTTASANLLERPSSQLANLNTLLYQAERLLTSPDGLPSRPWFQHQLYAPGFYTGYGVKTMPFIREAMEQQRWQEAGNGVKVVSGCLQALAARLDEIAGLMR